MRYHVGSGCLHKGGQDLHQTGLAGMLRVVPERLPPFLPPALYPAHHVPHHLQTPTPFLRVERTSLPSSFPPSSQHGQVRDGGRLAKEVLRDNFFPKEGQEEAGCNKEEGEG